MPKTTSFIDFLKTFMKQLICVIILGLFACNSKPDKPIESKLMNPVYPILKTLKQPYTLHEIPKVIKQKEYFKSTLANSWERSNKEFPFNGWLSEFKDSDSIKIVNSQVDSLVKQNIPIKITKQSFNLLDEWKLEYYLNRGWYGMPPSQIKNRNNCYYSKSNKFILTGADIFEIFRLSDKIFPLNYCPLILSRGGKFNSEWTAILVNKNKLIVRLVSSYPDGNQTSWQYEKLYLFVKINK